MPNYIYRYKYLKDGAGLRAVIGERTMRFTKPQDFNDPFDCMPAFKVSMSRDLSVIDDKFKKKMRLEELGPKKREQTLCAIEKRMKEVFSNGEFLSGMLSGYSVLSLSKIPDSTLMWSHYALDHKGAVVEFKIDISKRPFSLETSHSDFICQDVIYSKDRPIMRFDGRLANPETILDELILTKSDVWAYEQESRVLKCRGDAGNFKFNDSMLNSVILGARNGSSKELIELVRSAEAALQRQIPVYQAKFCDTSYKLDIPDFEFRLEDGTVQSAHPSDR